MRMPFVFPYPIKKPIRTGLPPPSQGRKGLAGTVPSTTPRPAPAPGKPQESRSTNPRAAAPVPTSLVQLSVQHVTTETRTLGASPVSTSSVPLPANDDIIDMYLNTTVTFDAGATVTGSVQATTAIQQIFIYNNYGEPVDVILGENLHMLYANYSIHKTDFTDTATTVVASTNSQSANSVVQFPYLRLPAADGPFSLMIFFSPLSSLGSWAANNGPTLTAATGLTSASVAVGIDVVYGNAEGVTSYIQPATIAVGPGENDIQTKVPMQNMTIAELILYNFAADSDLQFITIQTNGQVIESYTSEGQLVARDNAYIQAARPAGLFWLLPNSQFALNSSSTFAVFLTPTATTAHLKVVAYRVG